MSSVVLHDSFLEAAYQLPKEIARKVWKALRLFARNPSHPSLSLERLHGGASGLLSLRVDDSYRITLREGAPAPNLLFVSTHDDAYRFALGLARAAPAYPDIRAHEISPRFFMLRSLGVADVPDNAGVREVPLETAGILIRTKKYMPLARFLLSVPPQTQSAEVTFEQIERLIGGPLPKSAATHRSWWGNDISGHVQAAAWLASGWKVSKVGLTGKVVTFVRL